MKLIYQIIAVALCLNITACKSGGGEKKTSTGYKYVILKEGNGKIAKPEEFAMFTLTVRGDNGKVFNESKDPSNYPVMQVPKDLKAVTGQNPFSELFMNVREGDSLIFYMPIDSLQAPPTPELQNVKTIEYVMCIKKIVDKAGYDTYMKEAQVKMELKNAEVKARFPEVEALAKKTVADYKAGKLQTKETPGGVKYFIHEEGTGKQGANGSTALVQYYGLLTDGTMFDNSFQRGQPYPVNIGSGGVIKGWDDVLQVLKAGTKATVFIPSELGYGKTGQGSIPPDAELAFYMEVTEVK